MGGNRDGNKVMSPKVICSKFIFLFVFTCNVVSYMKSIRDHMHCKGSPPCSKTHLTRLRG